MPVFRRRPLLRAAAIGGTAYYVGSKRQQNKAQQDQIEQQQAQLNQMSAAPAPPAGPSEDDKFTELAKLGQLHDSGVLTDEEFTFEKTKILNS